jgi:hypothetical protein
MKWYIKVHLSMLPAMPIFDLVEGKETELVPIFGNPS